MTKKVLFTGPSGISCGLGNRLGIISNTTSLLHAYNDMDYKVEQRPVIPGECLNDYDLVFVTQQTIASFTAPFAHGMAWAVATVDPRKLYILTDDWQGHNSFKSDSIRNRKGQTQSEASIETLWRLDRKYSNEAAHNKRTVEAGIKLLHCENNELKYIYPTMGKPNLNLIGNQSPSMHKITYDPFYYMRELYSYVDKYGRKYGKKKRHIIAALQDNSQWLSKHNFEWPVVQLGVKKLGQPRVVESDLARIYASSWSILSPTHKQLVGSGWARVRNLMSTEAYSILLGDKSDLIPVFGEDYYISLEQIERSNEAQLQELAYNQKVIFDSFCWSKEQLLSWAESL